MRASRCTAFWPSLAALLAWALLTAAPCAAAGDTPRAAAGHAPSGTVEEFTFFQGTQYPLKVHVLRGATPGPTVMVQGGIQGDEVAGFLTAQLITRSHLRNGTLIVIPRANVPSICVRRRQVNVDLNRRFDRDYNTWFEDRLARVIRHFLAESQAFIHLHEGSGFHRAAYHDDLRNPARYGQSVIIDAERHQDLDLAGLVNPVLERLNQGVTNPDQRFSLFDTDTFASSTRHPEQRKSLTYLAVGEFGIPALAIEVSKDIRDLDWKVRRQFQAACLFLEALGLHLDPPEDMDQAVRAWGNAPARLTVNGRTLEAGQALPGQDRLDLPPYTALEVRLDGGAQPLDPALAVFASDRQGLDLTKTPRLPLQPFSTLQVLSDGELLAEVPVTWQGGKGAWNMPAPGNADRDPVLVCWLNGRLRFVPAGSTLDAVAGDQLLLEGIWGRNGEILNLKGVVCAAGPNDGQDAGQEIILDPDTFLPGYLDRDAAGRWLGRVVRETPGTAPAEFIVRIAPRTVDALLLADRHGHTVVAPWVPDSSLMLPPGDYTLLGAWSSGETGKLLLMRDTTPLAWGDSLTLTPDAPPSSSTDGACRLTLRQATTFAPLGSMTFSGGRLTAQGPAAPAHVD